MAILALSRLALLLAASAAPTGLVPAAAELASGGTLAPPGGGFTAQSPGAGWAWYRPEQATGNSGPFITAPEDDSLRIVLTAGGESTAAQFEHVMKRVEENLRRAAADRGAQPGPFSYKEPRDFPGVLRFSTHAFHPVEGRRSIVGYVHLGRPTVGVQATFASAEEPPQLRQVAASIRRSTPAASLNDRFKRRILAGELVVIAALAAFAYYRSRRRPPSVA